MSNKLNIETIRAALRCGEPGCACQKPHGLLHCPAHEDTTPSLSVNEQDGKILVKCHGACPQDRVISALKEKGLWPSKNGGYKSIGKPCNRATVGIKPNDKSKLVVASPVQPVCNRATVLTLAELSAAKKIPLESLRKWGLADQKYQGAARVQIPYMNESGEVGAVRYRLSLNGAKRFIWRKGDRVMLYGLWRIAEFRKTGFCLLVEGESDSWTCWVHDIPAVGIPGKSTFRPEWVQYFDGMTVFLWQEPDAPELPGKLFKHLPGLMVIPAPDGIKDLSQAHIAGQDVPALVDRLKAQATPAAMLVKAQNDVRLKELHKAAAPVLSAPDPLDLINRAVKTLGYGGDPAPVIICYLAITSRLLAMRPGAMPVHLLLLGQASCGKSFSLQTAMRLLPETAHHTIPAGSPRVLIYDDADLCHRAVIFGEADSLPAGEDNPAASAIRNLLQDHFLHYDVTVRDPESEQYTVKKVRKPGPTVLITTSTRRLGSQLDTRLFSLEPNDSPGHIRTALEAQANNELLGVGDPDPALIAFQEYLQALAPWEVTIPFVGELAAGIGKQASAPRILRDFARLNSLIKSVAVLRHSHRKLDSKGRIIAEIEDYQVVYDLVGQMYETTITGASIAVREVVQAVFEIGENCTAADLASHLTVNKSTAWRRARAAIRNGWLINTETRKGYPASLKLGDQLPEKIGLPSPERLRGCKAVAGGETKGATDKPIKNIDESEHGCKVAPHTDDLLLLHGEFEL
jgi:hypothetical protein